MIQYSSIPHLKHCKLLNKPVYSFYKYDGSNLRFEWQPKKGFVKFGSRTQLIDNKTQIFGKSIEMFQDTMSFEVLNRMEDFYSKRYINSLDRMVVFCEFFGANSFAGTHIEDEEHQLKLFDIHVFKKGFISPQDFVKIFSNFDHAAELLYQGNLNATYIQEVQGNTNNTLNEGVICKGLVNGKVEMVKVKTNQWIDKIKGNFIDWKKLV